MMTKEEKEKLENHIKEKIETLKKDVVSYKQLTRPIAPDNAIGWLTRMEAISSKSINEAALSRAKQNHNPSVVSGENHCKIPVYHQTACY